MINRRSAIKWLHWLSLAIIIWFFFVEPENVQRLGALALATHAGMGIILGLLVGAWFVMYLRKGLASRAGPKLPNWAKWLHPISHRILYFGSVIMVATGAAAGFAAPYIIKAFGFLPINPGTGTRNLHNQIEDIHETAFDVLMVIIVLHALFHIWRHFALKDNALKIMMPKALHRFL